MKKVFTYTFAGIILLLTACSENKQSDEEALTALTTNDSAVGKVEIFDAAANALIDSNATIEVIAKGFTWSEGPVWIADKKMLLFSDVPENRIYQWKEGDTAKLFLTPSGYTSPVKRIGGEDGSNGLALDGEGRLLLCQSGNRHVSRLNSSFDDPKPDFTILSKDYNGKKFNSPNDLVQDTKGNIYFTDPIYGLPQKENDSTRELSFEGVYKIDAKGKTVLLIDSIQNPNGIALSNDEKILYIASSSATKPGWFAYNLDANGNITSGGLFLDAAPMREAALVKQGADGFKLDNNGNIYSSGPDGINIISPAGKRLALIKIFNRPTSNCAFNQSKDELFITADDYVLRVKLHK